MTSLHLPPVSFYYLRHGETQWNRDRRIQGATDIPLNEVGRGQARQAADIIAKLPIAAVVASPMSRAVETAEIVNRQLGLPVEVEHDLREIGFGPHEGAVAGPWFREVINGVMPDGAEVFDDFIARALNGVRAALARPAPVLIVAHGGVFWAIERACGLASNSVLRNCEPVRLLPPADGVGPWSVQSIEEEGV